MREPTERQIAMLRTLVRLTNEKGYPPTMREMCKASGLISTNAMADYYRALERKGLIQRTALLGRSVQVTERGRMFAAGLPHAKEHRDTFAFRGEVWAEVKDVHLTAKSAGFF